MEHRWSRCRTESEVFTPKRCPRRRPRLARVSTVKALIPPRVSITIGTNVTPAAAQAASCADVFLASPTRRAWPWVEAAPLTVARCIVEITVTSKAAGWPRFQQGRKMSAGRLWELGMRDGTSLRGASAADWAAEKTASRSALCLRILSPFPPHPTW